jgi:hypothetical protein
VHSVQVALLVKRQVVRADKVAGLSRSTEICTTLSTGISVVPLLHTHVGVPAITAERCLDSGAIDVRFGLVVCDVRNDAEVDVSDIGVGTDHDAVEVLLELAVVHRHVFVDGATPEATPNPGSSGKVGACDAR